MKYIVEDCERLVEDASKLFDKYYNPDTYYSYEMEQEVKRGQAPKDVKRVDNAHDSKGQPNVHFKDGTSLNRDGTIHDKGHGRPNPSSKVWDWLHKHGWCQNGIK